MHTFALFVLVVVVILGFVGILLRPKKTAVPTLEKPLEGLDPDDLNTRYESDLTRFSGHPGPYRITTPPATGQEEGGPYRITQRGRTATDTDTRDEEEDGPNLVTLALVEEAMAENEERSEQSSGSTFFTNDNSGDQPQDDFASGFGGGSGGAGASGDFGDSNRETDTGDDGRDSDDSHDDAPADDNSGSDDGGSDSGGDDSGGGDSGGGDSGGGE